MIEPANFTALVDKAMILSGRGHMRSVIVLGGQACVIVVIVTNSNTITTIAHPKHKQN
jgi:hypothetical protein